MKKKIIFNCT